MDPLAGSYAYFTPYQFAGNKPILFIDLDGAEFQIPTFEKYKYGNNTALNVITVVDNVAINTANSGITLLNSSIYTIHKVFTNPSSIPEELKSDLGAMATETGKYVQGQFNYVANTSFKKQLSDGLESLKNPETYEGPAELATALFLTKNFSPTSQFAQRTSYLERSSIVPNLADDAARTVPQYTKSNLKLGQQMHNAYKLGENGIKEFRLPSGKRIDFLDVKNGIIYELKPFNPRAIKAGENQLRMYLQEIQSPETLLKHPELKGINWKTVLDKY